MMNLIFAESFEYSEMEQLKKWLQKTGRWVLIFKQTEIEVIPICAGNAVNYHESYIHDRFPTLCVNRHNDDIHELYNAPRSHFIQSYIDDLGYDYTVV
jgi:hypothetical protein